MCGNKVLTVVLPVYNEAEGIYENTMIIERILAQNNIPHEFLIVDDGSKDDSWSQILKLSENLSVKAIRFSRNFGKEAVLMAAIENISTDCCVIIDSDLQHPPELIPKMYEMWDKEKYEVIEGIKGSRGKEKIFHKLFAKGFYSMFEKVAGINLKKASDFRLLDKKVIDVIAKLPEKQTFFRGLSSWVGFKRVSIEFDVQERKTGKTSWSLFGLFKLALVAITSFSSVPLHVVTFLGILFLIGSVLLILQTLYMKYYGYALSGFTTVIILLLIIGSALMISLGTIGLYIEKIFQEVKGRPRYLVSEIIDETQNKSNL